MYFCLLGVDSSVSEWVTERFASIAQQEVFKIPTYRFIFRRLDFHHAVEELRIHSRSFNIRHYLHGCLGFLEDVPLASNLCILNSDSDYKRRASEDFGVGLASLLVVQSFQLPWHAITH